MHLLACLLTALILFALPARAGPASDRIFSTTALDLLRVNQEAIYTHVRKGAAGETLNPIVDGEIHVRIRMGAGGTREAVVTMGAAGRLRPVNIWPVGNGNPILPIFLESTLRTMARTTGGNPHYIRNRVKEALRADGEITPVTIDVEGIDIEAQKIVFTPFVGDRYRGRMGDFENLTLTFVVSEQMPGDIVRFTASTPAGTDGVAYHEEIVFSDVIMTEE